MVQNACSVILLKINVVRYDCVTALTRAGYNELMVRREGLGFPLFSRDALFDIGADTIGMIVPGGNIAVKLVKVAIDYNAKK